MRQRGGRFELDPLIGLNDARKPLRSRLLAVPSLKAKYLEHVKQIAKEWLDWQKLGPVVAQNRKLIEKEVEIDTRKLTSFASFQKATADEAPKEEALRDFRPGSNMNLRTFADQRRKCLLEFQEGKK